MPMPIIEIGFDFEWEVRNWYNTIFSKARYGLRKTGSSWGLGGIPEEIPSMLEGVSKEEAFGRIRQKLTAEIGRPEVATLIKDSIERARKRWDDVAEKFFVALSSMLDIPMQQFEPAYHAYFTLSTRAPFEKNDFMFNKNLDFGDAAMHEIMHIEFLKAYDGYCAEQGLNEEQIAHLKEILTVLLNEDVRDLLTRLEPGYMKHVRLREQVLDMYRKQGGKDGNFKEFLSQVILLVKGFDFSGGSQK